MRAPKPAKTMNLTAVQHHIPPQWKNDCAILAAQGLAWAELGQFRKAVDRLENARRDATSELPALALDRLMECRYRIASGDQDDAVLQKVAQDLDKRTHLLPSSDRDIMQASINRRRAILAAKHPDTAKEYLNQSAEYCRTAKQHDEVVAALLQPAENLHRRGIRDVRSAGVPIPSIQQPSFGFRFEELNS